ncbi:MAG: hypothetical protein ACXAEL_11545 [Candidatus Hodarchaeales archaeon]
MFRNKVMHFDIRNELSRKDDRVTLIGVPIAIHCHHYNIGLQKALEDTLGKEGVQLLFRVAEEESYLSFQSFFRQYGQIKTIKSKLEFARAIFQNSGLGIIHFKRVRPNGGRIVSPFSHHVTAWLAKYAARKTSGCHFSRGWIAGVLEVIYDRPLGYYDVKEKSCKMKRDDDCIFLVKEH